LKIALYQRFDCYMYKFITYLIFYATLYVKCEMCDLLSQCDLLCNLNAVVYPCRPFDILPKNACLDVGEYMQFDLLYSPVTIGSSCANLSIQYNTGNLRCGCLENHTM